METAYSVAGSPAVHLDRGIRLSGIGGKNTCDKSFIVVADGFSQNREAGAVSILGNRQDDLSAFLVYVLNSENTDLSILHLFL